MLSHVSSKKARQQAAVPVQQWFQQPYRWRPTPVQHHLEGEFLSFIKQLSVTGNPGDYHFLVL